MAENTKNVDELLVQIDQFEKTIKSLQENVDQLRKKLLENKQKYGVDISKWPKEEQDKAKQPL